MDLAFFKEKEAVSPEYGSGINAFESFEPFSVVSLPAGVAKVRKISSQGFPAAPMARGVIGGCDGEGLEGSPQSKRLRLSGGDGL